jgi:hypothetical protein
MEVDAHDIAAAVTVARNDQTQRVSFDRLTVATVGQKHLLALELGIDLGERKYHHVPIAPGHHDCVVQTRPAITA